MSSVAYYVTSQIFSNWVYNNFVASTAPYKIKEKDLIKITGQSYKLINGQMDVSHNYSESDALVFNIVGTENIDIGSLNSPMEIDTDSTFYSHKLNIIRDSIQYNLNLSMSTYNQMFISTKDYAMPVMQNEEWEKILNNVSIVAYMQGYNCGLKSYSNYKIVSSTNNEISVSPKEIYYTVSSTFSDENTEYHRIDCPKLYTIDNDSGNTNEYIAFLSKEVKYDKLYDKTNVALPYIYNHKNLACYECINDGNYRKVNIFNGASNTSNLRKAYYIGVGKARNNLYKMNAIENSQGFEILDGLGGSGLSSLNLKDIKSIEVVLNTIKTRDSEENVLNYTVKVDNVSINDDVYTIVPNIATKVTLKIDVDPTIDENIKVSSGKLVFSNIFDQSTAYIDNDALQAEADSKLEPERSTLIVKNSIDFVRVIYK